MRICGKASNTVNTVEVPTGIPWTFRGTTEKRRKEGKNLYVKFDKILVFIVYYVINQRCIPQVRE